jgi:hypothetical protein
MPRLGGQGPRVRGLGGEDAALLFLIYYLDLRIDLLPDVRRGSAVLTKLPGINP